MKLPKVLIAEDDKVMRLKLTHILTKNLQAEVLTAEDGEEAWKLFLEHNIHFVISDWMMPGCDGPELCQRIRKQEREIYTYFILVTGKTEQDDLLEGLAAGADDYVTKPYDQAELISRVRAGFRVVNLQLELAEKNHQLAKAIETKDEALRSASKMQRSMLPSENEITEINTRTGLSIVYNYLASESLGGDVLGLAEPEPGKIVLYLCDISGHGVAASLAAVSLHTFIRTVLSSKIEPAEVCADINTYCLSELPEGTFATMVYMLMDIETRKLKLLVAGHPPVACFHADGGFKLIESTVAPFGLFEEQPRAEDCVEITLEPNDRLVAYTDGVIEARNPAGEFFDKENLVQCIAENIGKPLIAWPEMIGKEIDEWCGAGQPAEDDITILTFGFVG